MMANGTNPTPSENSGKIVFFSIDGTLIHGRVMSFLSSSFGFEDKAKKLLNDKNDCLTRTKRLASLFSGIKVAEFTRAISSLPLMRGAHETIRALNGRGYRTGVVTDSYQRVANSVKERLGMDFAVGHALEIVKPSTFSGEVRVLFSWVSSRNGCPVHPICKKNVIRDIASSYGVPLSNCVMVGDGEPDACALREAGIGVAFMPKSKLVEESAKFSVKNPDLRGILQYCP